MLMSPWTPMAPPTTDQGGVAPVREYDPGAMGVSDPGPNNVSLARNAAIAARIAALRANPMFKASKTPIAFPGGQAPGMNSMLSSMADYGSQLAASPYAKSTLFRPTRRY